MKSIKDLFVNKETIELKERVDKLERIIKYAKADAPSFRVEQKPIDINSCNWMLPYGFLREYILYLYINGEEYSLDLGKDVIGYDPIIYSESTIEVDDDVAYIDLYILGGKYIKQLTIDYRNGAYVCNKKAKRIKKEKTKDFLSNSVVVDEVNYDKCRNDILSKLNLDPHQVSQIDPDSVTMTREGEFTYNISFKLKKDNGVCNEPKTENEENETGAGVV